jgi:hypothetical protein
LNLNKIIGISVITSKEDFPEGVGTFDGNPNATTDRVDQGALLGLKFHMAESTAFSK